MAMLQVQYFFRPAQKEFFGLARLSSGFFMLAFFLAVASGYGFDGRVLGTDLDLEGFVPFPAKPLVSWQWTAEEKKMAGQFSSMELVRNPDGEMLWTLRVSPEIPFKRPYLETLYLGVKYFPPEADAIRMMVKAVAGKMIFSMGGPTAYFGNSDVFLRPVFVDASKDGSEWRTVEFSLHDGLLRNFRRSGFSTKAPWIYYARWAQEPTRFYLFKGSGGEMQIKNVEIVTKDIARPFPAFSEGDVVRVATLAEFKSPADGEKAFTALVGDVGKEFDLSWSQAKPVPHPPAEIQIATSDRDAGNILRAKGLFLEEVGAVGVAISDAQEGEGLLFRIKADTEAMHLMIPAVPCQPVDFLIYESTGPFDWKPFLASQELRNGPGKGYDRNLTFEKLKGMPGLSLAIYHARRFLPKGQWCDAAIPFADFLCIYGSGDLAASFQRQLPPDPKKLVAAALLASWPRTGRFETGLALREISLVKFRGELGSRKSYFQFPDAGSLRSVKSPKGGYSILLAPGETDLSPELKQFLGGLD